MNTWQILLTTAGMVAITLLTRGFFILPRQHWPLPAWLQRGLRYAPVGALAAVVAPELVMNGGHLIDTWRDPRLIGALAGTLWFVWRRDILGTIVSGTAVMLVLKLGLGW